MRTKLRSVLFVITVGLTLVAAPASLGAPPPQAPSVVDSYTGCLRATLIVQVAVGDAPAGSCGAARVVHLSGGDLTSLAAGTGLTGGGTNGDVAVALAPGFRLPQTCAANQGTTWNGSAWACASLTSQATFDSLVSLLGTPGTINQSSNPVHWTKLKGVPAGFADGTDDAGPAYSAGFGLLLNGTQFNVDPSQVQRRVADSCAAGSSIRAIATDGTVTCQPGTGYTAGAGLALNGTEFSVADNGVTPTKLSFDPATQAELDNGLTHLDANNLRAGRVPDGVLFGGYSNGLTFSNANNIFLGELGIFKSTSASRTPLQVVGAAGQTAPLQAWGDSSGTILASVKADGIFDGNGSALTNLNADSLAIGTVPDGRLSADVARYSSISTPGTVNDPGNPLEWSKLKNVPDGLGAGWALSGNSGTSDSDFIGTLDDRPLNLKVHGQRALRLEPKSESPNVIGGHGANAVDPGAYGATIGGGGTTDFPNLVSGIAGTVGGGTDNRAENSAATVAGGHNNRAGGGQAAIGGGICNVANGDRATISGGECNVASGDTASVLGGSHNQAAGSYSLAAGSSNTAEGDWSTISGGENNRTGGNHATVPGGSFNEAIGAFSFAAGFRAHADDTGSFVWGDSTDEDVSSTGPDQFVVQAHGGLHLRDGQLFCNGCVTAGDLAPDTAQGLRPYCALAQANPQSYPDAPCRAHLETLNAYGSYTSMAIGTDGNPVISFRGTGFGMFVARCTDPTCSGSTMHALDAVGVASSIAIGTDGNPIVSYSGPPGGALKVAHCNDAACATSTLHTLDPIARDTSIAIGTDGNPVVSYSSSGFALKVAHCSDPACTASSVETVDTEGEASSIAIGTDGNPVISYRGPLGPLKIARCNDPACSSSSLQTLDVIGQGTSLAIGADGNAVVSYSGPSGVLKVVHCGDAACATSTLQTLDTHGFPTSIAIGADGNPLVSYAGPGDALKLVRCNDAACAGSSQVTLDSAGFESSIAIGIDGDPIISYRGPADAFKVARPAILS